MSGPNTRIDRLARCEERVSLIPLQRIETPEDVAAMAAFLASADADFITGQSYHVDGGLMML